MKISNLVVSVDRTPYSGFGGYYRTGVKSFTLSTAVEWESIPIKVPASMSITDKDEDKISIYTATLKFYTCEDITSRKHYVWRVTLSDGRQYLLGTNERPWAMMTVTENMPDSVTDMQLYEVTVTYSVPHPIPLIGA